MQKWIVLSLSLHLVFRDARSTKADGKQRKGYLAEPRSSFNQQGET